MLLIELYQALVETQGPIPAGLPGAIASSLPGGSVGIGGGLYSCSSNCSFFFSGQPGCPGSSFSKIAAAFATQGYFAHADVLWQLTNTNMGLWAPLLYICAAIGGLVSLAMGMPPKMYLWFFMGPGIYHFLLGTTVPALGTSWCVANIAQDQTEVWKLAEVGLKNSNIVARSRARPGLMGWGQIKISQYDEPSNPVEVSSLFLWFDALISSTVQWLTVWTGVYQQVGSDDGNSGILKAPQGFASTSADQYYLLSNTKWPMLDRITGARLHNGDVRDALVTFLSSECGDTLARSVEPGNLMAASNSKTGDIPFSVFRGVEPPSNNVPQQQCSSSTSAPRNYSNVTKALSNQLIPVPRSVRRSWWNPDRTSGGGAGLTTGANLKGSLPGFYQDYSFSYPPPSIPFFGFFGFGGGFQIPIPPTHPGAARIDTYLENEDNMSCADLMFYVINGMRWEAGQAYYQMVSTAPQNMKTDQVIFNLFYGWDLRDQCDKKLENAEQLRSFLQDLILVHLVRNEMAIAPKVVDSRYLQQSATAGNDSNRFIAETGGKSKFGEIYVWALMTPYLQGVLLYLFAMMYPFVCVVVVVPGWHKTLFTWMSFWAWVKLWDVGFAIVIVLERTIWAIMGNNSTAQNLSGHIVEMQNWAKVNVETCRVGGPDCPVVPAIVDGMTVSGADGLREAWQNLLAVFDRAMLVGSSIDIDIQNGYYIYIMSALYFAVPAVTGQLVLGAKAGAAGLASNLFQGAQSDGGRAASQAFTGGLRNAAAANSASVSQAGTAKAFRGEGIAGRAIQAGNEQAQHDLAGRFANAAEGGLGRLSSVNGMNSGMARSNLSAGLGMANLWTSAHGIAALEAMAGFNKLAGVPDGMQSRGLGGGATSGGVAGGSGGVVPGSLGGGTGGSGVLGGGIPTRGAGPTGVAGSASGGQSGAWSVLGAMAAGNLDEHMRRGISEGINAVGSNAIDRGFNRVGLGLMSGQANAAVAGFGYGFQGTAAGNQQSRLGGHAEFNAEMGAWEGRRDFANQTSGYLSALGVDSSAVSPGSKPSSMMGMAMSGMLGSGTKDAANYFAAGGAFLSGGAQAQSQLDAMYGGAAVSSAYNSGTWGGELTNAAGAINQSMPSMDQIQGIYSQSVDQTAKVATWMATGGDPNNAPTLEGIPNPIGIADGNRKD